MAPPGARSSSVAATSAYAADDFVPARRQSVRVRGSGDASDAGGMSPARSMSDSFEVHALCVGERAISCAGASAATPGDAVVAFAPRSGENRGGSIEKTIVWRRADGFGGFRSCATASEANDVACGAIDGRVVVYRLGFDRFGNVASAALIRTLGASGSAPARRLATVRCGRGETFLIACTGDGGRVLRVWGGETYDEIINDTAGKGFASGSDKTWIGTSSAYAKTSDSSFCATSFDRKSLMCVEVGANGSCKLAWRSRREPGRGIFLAGAAVIERGGVKSSRAVATCSCAEMVSGTTYAAPDSTIKLVIVDAEDGSEFDRFQIEGLGASNVFVDCGSLQGVGSNLFLALRDGAVWVINSGNGALVTSLHPPQDFVDTSGHKRTLPSLLALAPSRDEMYGATADGGVVNAWRVGVPRYWSAKSHKNFPIAFREAVIALLMCAKRAASSSTERAFRTMTISNKTNESVVSGVDGNFERLAHVEGFFDVVLSEPALLEMIIARMAKSQYGCDVVDSCY